MIADTGIVLYCTVLYCTVLYCTVLYCTVLYCTVPYRTVLYCTVLEECDCISDDCRIADTGGPAEIASEMIAEIAALCGLDTRH